MTMQQDLISSYPLSLYLHIPWCLKKCPYCDFNSHHATSAVDEDIYINALINDLIFEIKDIKKRKINSIFIGGGTPSLFSADSIRMLLQNICDLLPFNSDMEITLEANPSTLETGRYNSYLEAGVNRLSLGIQSFDQKSLASLGRVHTAAQALAAVKTAKTTGFSSINLDLMFGLPEQTQAVAVADVQCAIELRPDHVSYYQLTVEPNTGFYVNPPVLPDEDRIWEMQKAGHELLVAAGYRQYEISAYALPGHECRHNLNYWRFGDYLGLGAGAHGKIKQSVSGATIRRWRVRGPDDYIRKAGSRSVISGEYRLMQQDLILEYMMNALRLNEGFTLEQFQHSTNISWDLVQPVMSRAERRGLVTRHDDTIRPTAMGHKFLNDLLQLFIL